MKNTPRVSAGSTAIQTASSWFLRRDAGEFSSRDELSLQEWLAESEKNRVAYERVCSMWQAFGDPTSNTDLKTLREAALAASMRRPNWPRMAAAIALAIVLPSLAIVYHWKGQGSETPVEEVPTATQHFTGAADHISTVTLSDGTTVALSFNADMSASFTPRERHVVLTRGEAFFAVSKNPRRPFTVEAGDQRVLAVGTQFDVRLESNRVEIILVQGNVSVRDTRNEQVNLLPNQRLIAIRAEPPLVFKVDAQRLTSWRSGWITFENESLADAVEEFNRYSVGPGIVANPDVGSLRLGGVFSIGRPDRFAAVVQELLPVKVILDPEGKTQLVLTKKLPTKQ